MSGRGAQLNEVVRFTNNSVSITKKKQKRAIDEPPFIYLFAYKILKLLFILLFFVKILIVVIKASLKNEDY